MKSNLLALVSALSMALAGSGPAIAGETEKHVIAIKTNDFELVETDISDLEIGEARTIVTDDGKNIDIIRATEGLEIYVDGELQDLSFGDMSGVHKRHHRMVMDCESTENDCEDFETLHSGEGLGAGDSHGVVVKKIHVECTGDDDSGCAHGGVWVTDEDNVSFGDIEVEKIIESNGEVRIIHMNGDDQDFDPDDIDVHEIHEVIVVREESED